MVAMPDLQSGCGADAYGVVLFVITVMLWTAQDKEASHVSNERSGGLAMGINGLLVFFLPTAAIGIAQLSAAFLSGRWYAMLWQVLILLGAACRVASLPLFIVDLVTAAKDSRDSELLERLFWLSANLNG